MSRLLYLRVFNVRDYFIPRVLLLPTFWRIYLEYISRPPDYEYESGFTNRVYHAELLCHHKALRRKNLPTTIRREEVQCSSELEQQSVSSMGSNVVRDSLHLLVVPLSAIYLSVFFFFYRKNLVYLQVGYKTFSYELFRQKAQYDSGALMGKNINTVDPP